MSSFQQKFTLETLTIAKLVEMLTHVNVPNLPNRRRKANLISLFVTLTPSDKEALVRDFNSDGTKVRPEEVGRRAAQEEEARQQEEELKMQVFTPFAEEWKLEKSDIENAEKLFAEDYNEGEGKKRKRRTTSPSKLLLFLYAKGILAEEDSVIRKRRFKLLLAAETDKLKKALERLTTIVEKGETTPTRLKMEADSVFDDFVTKHKEWKAEDSFVVFRDHQNLKGKSHALVERFQKSGLCYMHACVVVQHYLVAMNNDKEVPMLNMAEYLKKYMPGDRLYQHIWNNKGGDSLDFLENILKEKPGVDGIASRQTDTLCNDDLDALLKSYGPGLVSGFAVAKDFIGTDWQHLGKYLEKCEGRHAMVLVGYRIADGKKRYLLQNWWKSKPYVEVDVEYLLSSKAAIHFIKEKQMEMGDYPTNLEALVECESGIDASENFIPDN